MKRQICLRYPSGIAGILTTLLVLLLGVFVIQMIVVQTEISVKIARWREETGEKREGLRMHDAWKRFMPDGTIHLIEQGKYQGRGELYRELRIFDANDNLLWEGLRKDVPFEYLNWAERRRGRFRPSTMKEMQMITPELSQTLDIPVCSGGEVTEIWRYEPGRQCFAGYSIRGERLGYAGSNGFTETISRACSLGGFRSGFVRRGEDSCSPMLLWQTKRRIYEIGFAKRAVELIFESAEADITDIHTVERTSSESREQEGAIRYRPMLQVSTDNNEEHLLLRNPEQRLTVAMPDDWHRSWVKITATNQGIFLERHDSDRFLPRGVRPGTKSAMQWWMQTRNKVYTECVELYRVESDGGLELLNRFDWTVQLQPVIMGFPVVTRPYLTAFSPLTHSLIWHLFAEQLWWFEHDSGEPMAEAAGIITGVLPIRPWLNWMFSAVMAAVVLWHGWARRTSWVKLIGWIVVAGAFNLARLLTYLALNHTATIKCPLCGKMRGLERSDCVRCDKDLPRPERKPTDMILAT